MNNAELSRAENLIKIAAKNVLNKIKREHEVFTSWHYSKLSRHFEYNFEKAVLNQCKKIIKASEVKPAIYRQIERDKEKRKQERKLWADKLKSAKARLRTLEFKIREAEKLAEIEMREKRRAIAFRLLSGRRRLASLRDYLEGKYIEVSSNYTMIEYPPIPEANISPSKEGSNLPYVSGIYFLWNGGQIEYVGQAKYLCNRLRLGNHHILNENHKISFVVVNAKQLTWTECYYIGVCRPQLNFGRMASHYEDAA